VRTRVDAGLAVGERLLGVDEEMLIARSAGMTLLLSFDRPFAESAG